jgi:hypothetical protein
MGNLDVMTALLARFLGIDPVQVPGPVALLGFTMTVMWATFLVWVVWTILRSLLAMAADLVEVGSARQRIVVARGLTAHDVEQIRRGIRAWRVLVIRHGSDDYLGRMAGEADRQAGRARHDVIGMRLSHTSGGEVVLSFRLPVHRRLGTQFLCFAEPRDPEAGSNIVGDMLRLYDEIEAIPSETAAPRRLYFLLRCFPIVTAADGARRNFAMPE